MQSPEVKEPEQVSCYYDTLVLSGGSSKGIITLGAIQYVHDQYLMKNVKTYIGTSSGSMIAYLLAIGYSPTEIMVYICTNQLLEKMQNFNLVAMIQGRGACSFNNIHEQLEKMTISKIGYFPTLNDLYEKHGKILVCATYNLTEHRTEYLSWETHPHLPCLTAVRMSSNLPMIFEIFKYGNCSYVDGGISDNFPIDIGCTMGKKVLGICLESDDKDFSNDPDINTLELMYKLLFVPITQAVEHKIRDYSDRCDIRRIRYNGKVKFFQFNIDISSKFEMFSTGYQKMKELYEV
jgi:predicted acylesterase/phospholipase RssA